MSRTWSVTLALLSIAIAAPAAPPDLAGLLPPDAKIVIGLKVRPLLDLVASQGLGKELHGKTAEFLAQAGIAGFDPFQDIDELLIASNAQGKDAPTLAVITGRFNVETLSRGAKHYRDAALIENAKSPKQVLALLDASTVLAGDLSLVCAAIDRRAAGAHVDPALAARIEPLRGRYDIWGAGDRPEGATVPPGTATEFQSMDRFLFGATLSRGLDLTAEIHVQSAKDAEKLASSLKLFEAMLAAKAPSNGARFNMQSQNGTLKVSLSVPEAEWKKALQTQGAAMRSAFAARLAAGAAQPKPEASREPVIVKDANGDTMSVTLPPP